MSISTHLAHEERYQIQTLKKAGVEQNKIAALLGCSPSTISRELRRNRGELYLSEEQPGEESPCERLLGDAMSGDGALFTREDAVEAAWTVVDPVLDTHPRALRYKPGSWGPKPADALIAADGRWHNPTPGKVTKMQRQRR